MDLETELSSIGGGATKNKASNVLYDELYQRVFSYEAVFSAAVIMTVGTFTGAILAPFVAAWFMLDSDIGFLNDIHMVKAKELKLSDKGDVGKFAITLGFHGIATAVSIFTTLTKSLRLKLTPLSLKINYKRLVVISLVEAVIVAYVSPDGNIVVSVGEGITAVALWWQVLRGRNSMVREALSLAREKTQAS